MNSTPERKSSTALLAISRANGVFIAITALALGLIGWMALAMVAANLHKDPELENQIAPLALACIEHRAWFAIAAILPFIAGVILTFSRRSQASSWIIAALAYLLIFAEFCLILYSFIMFLSPLYTYRPL